MTIAMATGVRSAADPVETGDGADPDAVGPADSAGTPGDSLGVWPEARGSTVGDAGGGPGGPVEPGAALAA